VYLIKRLSLFRIFDFTKYIKMSGKLDRKKFIRFYFGIATDREKKAVYDSKESETMLREVWDDKQEKKSTELGFDKQAVFSRIQNQISSNELSITHKISHFTKKYAAVIGVGLVLAASAAVFSIYRIGTQQEIAYAQVSNTEKTSKEILLPDGSKVTLNSKSSIKYPKKFARKNRTVTLDGEAFFDVTKDAKKPFIVKTSTIEIEVLGTSFNVMAFASDAIVETTLFTGKVKISRKNPGTNKIQSVILSPNHKATFYKSEERFVMDKVDVTTSTAWQKGELVFENEMFDNVIVKLQRWYNVEITLSDDLKNKHRLTMSIDTESLDETLNIIKKTLPVDYTTANGGVIIYSRKK